MLLARSFLVNALMRYLPRPQLHESPVRSLDQYPEWLIALLALSVLYLSLARQGIFT